jgi:hypothetical protein
MQRHWVHPSSATAPRGTGASHSDNLGPCLLISNVCGSGLKSSLLALRVNASRNREDGCIPILDGGCLCLFCSQHTKARVLMRRKP